MKPAHSDTSCSFGILIGEVLPHDFRGRRRRRKQKSKTEKRKIYRDRAISLFGDSCFYCERRFPLAELTSDHLVPQSRGGRNQHNIVPACQGCNTRKGDRMPTPEELVKYRRVVIEAAGV